MSLLIWPLARPPLKQRDERCAEAGLARTPLAQEHDQLLPDSGEGAVSRRRQRLIGIDDLDTTLARLNTLPPQAQLPTSSPAAQLAAALSLLG
jgi:hypothetical protein